MHTVRDILIDAIRHALDYLPAILLALPALYYLFREMRTDRSWRIVLALGGGAVMVVAGVYLAGELALAPHDHWGGIRLAPAVAWVKGYSLYYPQGQGPCLVQMYGPFSAVTYLHAALASRPTQALLIGSLTNLALFTVPAGWFILLTRPSGQPAVFALAAFALFLLVCSRQFPLYESAASVTIDAPAIGWATCALAVVARTDPRKIGLTAVLCGMFAAMSLWAKLTLAPIVIALPIYVLLAFGWRAALRFTSVLALVVACISALLLLCFGSYALFHMVIVPSRHPWHWPDRPASEAYWRSVKWLWRYAHPVGLLTIVALLIRPELACGGLLRRWRRDRDAANTGDRPGLWRDWIRGSPWLAPLILAVCVVPTTALAMVKWSGSVNNVVPWAYFALLGASAALCSACGSARGSSSAWDARAASEPPPVEMAATSPILVPPRYRFARTCLVALLVISACIQSDAHTEALAKLQNWRRIFQTTHEAAFEFARAHPGEVYLPQHPLSTLLAEGRVDHVAWAVQDLEMAGYPISDAHLRRWLPPDMAVILVTEQYDAPLRARLPEFHREIQLEPIHGVKWIAHSRGEPWP